MEAKKELVPTYRDEYRAYYDSINYLDNAASTPTTHLERNLSTTLSSLFIEHPADNRFDIAQHEALFFRDERDCDS